MDKIIHQKADLKFVLFVEGQECFLMYRLANEQVLDFKYTYVPFEMRGRGIAAELVKAGLEYARANNFKVIASCGYVKYFFQKNKEYSDLALE